MTTHVSRTTHVLYMHLSAGEALPEALAARLKSEGVATGTLSGHGVLEHVELRTYSPASRSLAPSRTVHGAVHAISLEGTIGMDQGVPSVALRAVLSRESDTGVETLSGVVVAARIIALEIVITSAQDLALPLAHDPRSGFGWLQASGGTAPERPAPSPPTPATTPTAPSAWNDAVAASNAKPYAPAGPLPARPPPRPEAMMTEEMIIPDRGDIVDHFAFGRSEVLKSDGDRLHLKVGKDGRIREIALEMLKVTLTDEPGAKPRHFKLERKV